MKKKKQPKKRNYKEKLKINAGFNEALSVLVSRGTKISKKKASQL